MKRYVSKVLSYAIAAMHKPRLIPLWTIYCHHRTRRAKAAVANAPQSPAYLNWDKLDQLQNTYPPSPGDYHYDRQSRIARGRDRAYTISMHLKKEWGSVERFLDLGSSNDMTCTALQKMGKQAVAVDIRIARFMDAATEARDNFVQMDAASLGFADSSFDCIFSFNSFEHFPNPNEVLAEAIRVVRPGGYIYLNFGPLYWSEKGSHQFKTIHVPYHQCLFSQELLKAYAAEKRIELVDFFWMNEWRVTQYRQLWRQYASQLEQCHYYETLNGNHVDLIERYPSCFKSKVENFDNFLVASIEVLFRRRLP